jgi:hypothetical protein
MNPAAEVNGACRVALSDVDHLNPTQRLKLMPESLITTDLRGCQPLVQDGRQLIKLHPQLSEVLQSRLGPKHAQYLAMPKQQDEHHIQWLTGLIEHAMPASRLDAATRQTVERRACKIEAEMREMANQLALESPTGRFYAGAIEKILEQLPQSELFSVDSWPIRAAWGLENASRVSPPSHAPDKVLHSEDLVQKTQAAPRQITPPSASILERRRPWTVIGAVSLALAGILLAGAGSIYWLNRQTVADLEELTVMNQALKYRLAQPVGSGAFACTPAASR